jgi:ribokinase
MTRIVVLGSFVQACCWKVERLPQPGETFTASALSIEAGGKGLNVAIGASRLGAQVEVLLGIGEDAAADGLLRLLQSESISAEYVWRLAPQSGYGAGLIAADGQNAIAVYPGPNLLLNAHHAQLAQTAIASAHVVYGQLEASLAVVSEAFHIARRCGVRTVLNPSPWQTLPASLLHDTDVLVVNEVEVRDLLGLCEPLPTALQACATVLGKTMDSFWTDWTGSLLVVTLGAAGSVALERSGAVTLSPGFEVTAVDTVGAGDAFASALCVALAQGMPLSQALRYGNACGARMASHFGVLDALPSQAALQAFMAPSSGL